MKILIGGAVAAVLGVIGISIWFFAFVELLKGAVPAMFILGGALAIYIGFDELKDSWKSSDSESSGENDQKKYEQEIDELKKEVKTLKSESDK